jgi:hypothetical protein
MKYTRLQKGRIASFTEDSCECIEEKENGVGKQKLEGS